MAGQVAAREPGRRWARIGFALVGGLVLVLGLAALLPWNGGAGLFAPPTATATATATATVTPTASDTPTVTPSATPTNSPTVTLTPLPTNTPTPSVTPTLPPTPTPLVTPPPAGAVFGLAWFHKPPEDGTTALDIAKEHSYIHLTSKADMAFRDEVRAAGYTGPIYTYMDALAVEGPGPYKNSSVACDPSYEPHDSSMTWDIGDFCSEVHSHESWFLHNSKGARIAYDYFGHGHVEYLMNPADPGWQAWSQARLRVIRDTWGYDGVWLDNLDLDRSRSLKDSDNSDGQVREFSSDTAWGAAVVQWLAGVRKALGSYPIWANLVYGPNTVTSWDDYAPYLDGGMDESFSAPWLTGWRTPADWDTELSRAERWLASGKGLVMVGQGDRTYTKRMLFTLASYMLVAQGDQAFYRFSDYSTFYNRLWLYPEYDTARALGAPLGPRQQISSNVWRRLFANGSVEVNTDDHTGQLVLSKP